MAVEPSGQGVKGRLEAGGDGAELGGVGVDQGVDVVPAFYAVVAEEAIATGGVDHLGVGVGGLGDGEEGVQGAMEGDKRFGDSAG